MTKDSSRLPGSQLAKKPHPLLPCWVKQKGKVAKGHRRVWAGWPRFEFWADLSDLWVLKVPSLKQIKGIYIVISRRVLWCTIGHALTWLRKQSWPLPPGHSQFGATWARVPIKNRTSKTAGNRAESIAYQDKWLRFIHTSCAMSQNGPAMETSVKSRR